MMASLEHVKAYVACWLQMGKAVDVDQPLRTHQLNPDSVIDQDGYSPEFERNWRYMVRNANEDEWCEEKIQFALVDS